MNEWNTSSRTTLPLYITIPTRTLHSHQQHATLRQASLREKQKKQKNIEQNSKTNKTNPWKRTRADHVVLCQCLFKHCCFFVFLNVFLFFCFCLVFLCFFFGFVDFDVMTHTRLNGRCKQTFEKTKKTKKTKKH